LVLAVAILLFCPSKTARAKDEPIRHINTDLSPSYEALQSSVSDENPPDDTLPTKDAKSLNSPHRVRKTAYPDAVPWTSGFGGGCIFALQREGLLPLGKIAPNGTAGSLAVKPVELKPGMLRVVRTNEGKVGHVLEIWVNEKGIPISVTEGGHPVGVGREVDPNVIMGEVVIAKARW